MSAYGTTYQSQGCYTISGYTPTCLRQEEAWLHATSPTVHGDPRLLPHTLLNAGYCFDSFQEQMPSGHHNASLVPNPYFPFTAAIMSAQSTSPSTSPIEPKMEYVDYAGIPPSTSTQHPCDSHTLGPVGICEWRGCNVQLDDLSHAGIRRHFRAYHAQPRGSTLRCQWGVNCRSEEMLFDNIAKHIAECHLKSMKRECSTCGNSFARNDTLKRHLNAGCPGLVRQ
ncbi:hypothetical protein BD311DRAFT_865456 [Dichomitus squalens]|uniref:C2H2-type domain-containing protein n=1 Tax=Dichomitus squalens TaxID=114155 RepID=A0A4Q9PYF6_9APHY|nr:hypothetical protein BD311DRAFT_865456 [Dichomitus squalens]TBU59334.1 hypothetical protein BD310DRAFT_958343 [Dichomitus squalens]